MTKMNLDELLENEYTWLLTNYVNKKSVEDSIIDGTIGVFKKTEHNNDAMFLLLDNLIKSGTMNTQEISKCLMLALKRVYSHDIAFNNLVQALKGKI